MPIWYDDEGPIAAALVNEWSSSTWLDLVAIPSVYESMVEEMFVRGLTLTADVSTVETLVDDEDTTLATLLGNVGFEQESGDVTAWVGASAAAPVSPLPDGYSLHNRATDATSVHHFAERSGAEVESRLQATSLYRPDLDMSVFDEHGDVAAYGLFWHDPVTGVGLVEPIGTNPQHRGKGLARHVVTSGLDKLADAGSRRMKVSYEGDNTAAVALYRSAGFEPVMNCSMWSTSG